jgi:hypothetical protein
VTENTVGTERTRKPWPLGLPSELTAMGSERLNDFVNVQTEFLDKIEQSNRYWLDRLQSEANLASEFAAKLTAARSLPDAISVCQECTNRRIEMIAEDGRQAFTNTQSLMKTGARLWSNGSQPHEAGAST